MSKNDDFNLLLAKFDSYRIAHKMRRTPEREIILKEICDYIVEKKHHFEADELFSSLVLNKRKISRATVFRTLNVFVDAGVLRKSKLGEEHSHYEVIRKNRCQHDHLICTVCGNILEFSNIDISKKIAEITKEFDFEMSSYKFEIYGRCQKCKEKK